MDPGSVDALLADQVAYYRAKAGSYDEAVLRDRSLVDRPELERELARFAPVEYVVADLFEWEPRRPYDVVFFSFWLSHVPPSAFDRFWQLVGRALAPDGRVFFIDDVEPRSNPDHLDDPERGVSRRRLDDGRQFEIVKIYRLPEDLEGPLAELGWDVTVRLTELGHCIVGQGRRRA